MRVASVDMQKKPTFAVKGGFNLQKACVKISKSQKSAE